MLDILSSTTTVLGTINNAIETIKLLKNSTHSQREIERNKLLADVTKALADAHQEISKNQQRIRDDAERIRGLEEQVNLKEKLSYVSPYYLLIKDDKKDGPYCQVCYDDKKKLIRLQEGIKDNQGLWDCNVCNKNFKDSTYNPPKIRVKRNNSF